MQEKAITQPESHIEISNFTVKSKDNKVYDLPGFTKTNKDKLEQTATQATQTQQKVSQIEPKLTTVEQKVQALESTKIPQIEQKVTAVEQKANTIEQVANKNKSDISSINDQLTKLEAKFGKGAFKFAYKDYTLEQNKAEMDVGVRYFVPFNKSGQYLQYDEATGQVAEDQAEGVEDKVLDFYKIVLKDSEDHVQFINQKFDQTGLAYIDEQNTFKVEQLLGADQNFAGANDKAFLTKKAVADELKNYANLNTANTFKQTVKSEAEQNLESADPNEYTKVSTLNKALAVLKPKVVNSLEEVTEPNCIYLIRTTPED